MGDVSGGVNGGDIRASDAEREEVVAALKNHLADGRLTVEEFSERLDEAYAARTRGELSRATRQLPVISTADGAHRRRMPDLRYLAGVASPSLVCVAIWFADGHQGSFWPAWVMVGSGCLALRRYSRGRRHPEIEETSEESARATD
jgi:hypothetical protein